MYEKIKIILFITATIIFSRCIKTEVEGIEIGHNLYDTQGYSKNKELINLIKQSLKKDEKSLAKLINFWCGGGAGCYDLGIVMTQIISKIGEDEFVIMTNKLSTDDKTMLVSLIGAGLEYGDNNRDNKMDETTIDKAFPKLYAILGK